MSQRFIRCQHCGLPHDVMQVACPITGKPMARSRGSSSFPRAAPMGRGANIPAPPPVPVILKPATPPAPAVSFAASQNNKKRELVGRVVNAKYRVRSILGEGGMGTVYEAENLAIGRSVAVKILHPSQARKKDAVKRFHQEARSAGAIGHPNICEVYDFGTLDDGSPYLVMEKLVGETLADRIASEGGLPFDDVIEVLTQVLSGLVAAHERGVIHRDIKPENIFLTRRVGCPPIAKILDFGVSKMIHPVLSGDREDDLDLTRTGMVMGTPYYMSPEQARGDRNLDARVDLWACGIILYEALTGRRPFQAANYNALLMQILTTDPKPARDLRPALPIGFDSVILKSMARSREDRYASSMDFQKDLQALRDRRQPAAQMTSAGERRSKVPNTVPAPRDAPRPVRQDRRIGDRRGAVQPSRSEAGERERDEARARAGVPDFLSDDTPSSLEIPITFAADTPLSGEQVPMMDVNKLDAGERRVMERLRESAAKHIGLSLDDDETQVSTHAYARQETRAAVRVPEAPVPAPRAVDPRPPTPTPATDTISRNDTLVRPPSFNRIHETFDADTTQRRGPEFDAELEGARANLVSDTIPQDPPQFAPPPRPPHQRPPSIPPPPARPSTSRSKLVPPPPFPRSKSIPPPPPPPPPRPMSVPALFDMDDDDGDNDRTQLFSKAKPKRTLAGQGAGGGTGTLQSADDTVKMDDNLEERLREARERLGSQSSMPPPTEARPMVIPAKKSPR